MGVEAEAVADGVAEVVTEVVGVVAVPEVVGAEASHVAAVQVPDAVAARVAEAGEARPELRQNPKLESLAWKRPSGRSKRFV